MVLFSQGKGQITILEEGHSGCNEAAHSGTTYPSSV